MTRIEHQWSLAGDSEQPTRYFGLSLPSQKAPSEGWPLLCLLDGDWTWPIVQADASHLLDRCAVLYPHYRGSLQHILQCRALDYTPSDAHGQRWSDPRVPAWQCGGATHFMAVLEQQLLDITQIFPQLNTQKFSLFGHSYAGLFILYALTHGFQGAQHFICASPSLWWRAPLVWSWFASWENQPPPHFSLIAGGDEKWHPQSQQGERLRQGGEPTLPHMHRLYALIQARVASSQLITLSQAGHGQVLPLATLRALTLAANA